MTQELSSSSASLKTTLDANTVQGEALKKAEAEREALKVQHEALEKRVRELVADFKKSESAVNLPINRCTSLTFFRLCISITTQHLLGLASMSRCVNIKPRNLPPSTLKTHLSGFNPMSIFLSAMNTSCKSLMCLSRDSNFTTTSST